MVLPVRTSICFCSTPAASKTSDVLIVTVLFLDLTALFTASFTKSVTFVLFALTSLLVSLILVSILSLSKFVILLPKEPRLLATLVVNALDCIIKSPKFS